MHKSQITMHAKQKVIDHKINVVIIAIEFLVKTRDTQRPLSKLDIVVQEKISIYSKCI